MTLLQLITIVSIELQTAHLSSGLMGYKLHIRKKSQSLLLPASSFPVATPLDNSQ